MDTEHGVGKAGRRWIEGVQGAAIQRCEKDQEKNQVLRGTAQVQTEKCSQRVAILPPLPPAPTSLPASLAPLAQSEATPEPQLCA